MALLNALLSSSSTTSTAATTTKKKGEIFINIGFKVTDPATKESVTIYLPFGMDLESMPNLNVTGSDENQLRNSLRNQLVTELISQGKTLEPGTSKVFDGSTIEVELRRKNSVKELKCDVPFAFKFI